MESPNENDFVKNVIAKVAMTLPVALAQRNKELLRTCFRLLKTFIEIEDLLIAMRGSHNKIEGQEGVASKLGISKNMVYVRFAQLGLDPERFRDTNSTVESLFKKSRFYSLLQEVESL